MSTAKIIPWPDRGYIRDGIYVIQKRIGGEKFHVSTRRDRPAQAESEYQRFADAPREYNPAGDEPDLTPTGPAPVALEGRAIDDYLSFCAAPDPDSGKRPNSKLWLYKKRYYLTWWAEELRGVNLREINLKQHVFPALRGKTARAHRIATLKDFFGWMHDAEFGPGFLDTNDSRCIELDLAVPQNRPRQETQQKWFPWASHLLVLERLTIPWMNEAARVLAAVGWHSTELQRFVLKTDGAGAIEDAPYSGLALQVGGDAPSDLHAQKALVTRHKSGSFHKTRVSDETAAHALQMQRRGTFDVNRLSNKLKEVSDGLGLDDEIGEDGRVRVAVKPGRYRFSVATWLFNSGVPLAEISTFLGHLSPATTKRFYAALGIAINPMLDWYARRPAITAPASAQRDGTNQPGASAA